MLDQFGCVPILFVRSFAIIANCSGYTGHVRRMRALEHEKLHHCLHKMRKTQTNTRLGTDRIYFYCHVTVVERQNDRKQDPGS